MAEIRLIAGSAALHRSRGGTNNKQETTAVADSI